MLAALDSIFPLQSSAAPQASTNREEIATEVPVIESNSAAQTEVPKPIKKKTGRKPTPLTCFLCPNVLPYKCALILHLQTVHHINRSQSLMYKRVNQGGEEIKRRYLEEAPVSGREKRRSYN